MNKKFLLSQVMRPIISRAPRGQNTLWKKVGAGDHSDQSWFNVPRQQRVFFDKHLQAYVWVDLADWSGREHYLCGRFYDRAQPMLIKKCIGAGDLYIDIGANYGFHTLCASRVVGDSGQVISFEPNPWAFKVLSAHLTINNIENCLAHNIGLSDEAAELSLSQREGHRTGTSTFRDVPNAQRSVSVPVKIGDEMLKDIPPARALVKIDTEGFEYRAICGLEDFLKRDNVAVAAEITDKWLQQTGSSAQQLFAHMQERDFKAFRYEAKHQGLKTYLEIKPIAAPLKNDEHGYDVLFARKGYLR